MLVVVLIIVAVLVAAGGIWYWEVHKSSSPIVADNNTVAASSSNSQADSGSTNLGLATYQDPEFGYSFEYPSSSDYSIRTEGAHDFAIVQADSTGQYAAHYVYAGDYTYFISSQSEVDAYLNKENESYPYSGTETINGNLWKIYGNSSSNEIQYVSYNDGLLVTLRSTDSIASSSFSPLGDILNTFQFAKSAVNRIDTVFNNLKVGDAVNGNIINSIQQGSGPESQRGQPLSGIQTVVGFAGSFTLTGSIQTEDNPNGDGPLVSFLPDTLGLAQLPLLSTSSIVLDANISVGNTSPIFATFPNLGNTVQSETTTIVINNFQETLTSNGVIELAGEFVKASP
jgi:hypothetical protein